MSSPVRNFLLSAVLIAVPATGFALVEHYSSPAVSSSPAAPAGPAAAHGLGDLAPYIAIVDDTQAIAARGDMTGAEHRITDLEVLWDKNEPELRKADAAAWTTVDLAADKAFSALRAKTPEPAGVSAALDNLRQSLAAPVRAATDQPVQLVAGIPVTDQSGHALPCEELVSQLRAKLAGKTPAASVADLEAKAIERCNADDDARADAFAAEALSQIKG